MKRLRQHQREIELLHDDVCEAIAEFQDKTERVLADAIERSGMDISECRCCGKLVVCIADGISNICVSCAEREAGGSP